MIFISNPREHLKSVDESYIKHGQSALVWGSFMVLTGLVLIIHGILPFLFAFVPAKNIERIKKKLELRNEIAQKNNNRI